MNDLNSIYETMGLPAGFIQYSPNPEPLFLTLSERNQIADILGRRANEIAGFETDCRIASNQQNYPGSVQMALNREIERLRRLAVKVKPIADNKPDGEEES